MILHPVVIVVWSIVVGLTRADQCRFGWIGHENSCYFFSRDIENWISAKTICRGYGAMLVEINDAREDQFIVDQINNRTYHAYWAGGTDMEVNGRWLWDSTSEPMDYTNWPPGEPNDYHSHSEDCLELVQTFGWNDSICSDLHNYICESENGVDVVG